MRTATLIIFGVLIIILVILTVCIIKVKDKKKSMLLRLGVIYISLVALACLVVAQIINIQYVEYDKLIAMNENDITIDTIEARRGNIRSDDGSLMASSLPRYRLFMDMRVASFTEPDKKSGIPFFEANVDSLAMAMAEKFKDKSAAEYKKSLMQAYKKKNPHFCLYKKTISYSDFKEVSKFPILRRGAVQGGLSVEKRTERVNAYGYLASRTIGDIYGIYEKGGKSGLENYYNKELCGQYGLKRTERIAGRNVDIIIKEPVDGNDIITTLDMKMQEILEQELMDELLRDGAECGCAVIMEVKTGKIKAIANLIREERKNSETGEVKSVYTENRNIAFGFQIDPGSTFKTVSALVAMEDGKIDTATVVDATKNGIQMFHGKAMRDYTAKYGYGFGKINVAEVLRKSSNVGISVLIEQHYGKDPQKFIDLLHKTKIDTPLELEIPGHARVQIKNYKDKGWSKISLPWMSIGYEVVVPPIYTLMFYNAIANDGRMMKPMLVSEIKSADGNTIRTIEPEVVNEKICSDETLKKIREVLASVVTKGTAKKINSELFQIAGKTGTSQIFSNGTHVDQDGHTREQITFCGFYPAEKPLYSCIVYIRAPKGTASAGVMCGAVFKNSAERIYIMKGGEPKAFDVTEDTVLTASEAINAELSEIEKDIDKIPDLTGKCATDALYILESNNIKVNLNGAGRVVNQSVAAGTDIFDVNEITLTLE